MEISSAKLVSPQLPFEASVGKTSLPPDQKLHEVSRQFEAILLRQIIGSAQKPVFKSKFNSPGVAGDVYRDMITEQMADAVSRSGSFGLARGLESQLQRQLKVDAKPAAVPPPNPVGQRPAVGKPPRKV